MKFFRREEMKIFLLPSHTFLLFYFLNRKIIFCWWWKNLNLILLWYEQKKKFPSCLFYKNKCDKLIKQALMKAKLWRRRCRIDNFLILFFLKIKIVNLWNILTTRKKIIKIWFKNIWMKFTNCNFLSFLFSIKMQIFFKRRQIENNRIFLLNIYFSLASWNKRKRWFNGKGSERHEKLRNSINNFRLISINFWAISLFYFFRRMFVSVTEQ